MPRAGGAHRNRRKRQNGNCRQNRKVRICAHPRLRGVIPLAEYLAHRHSLFFFLRRMETDSFAALLRRCRGTIMYHYNPKQALEELQEDALLPHPVKLRDMILRNQLGPQEAQLLNSEFQEYLTRFGEIQKIARSILEQLSAGKRKSA